jgi:cell division protein FtsQ
VTDEPDEPDNASAKAGTPARSSSRARTAGSAARRATPAATGSRTKSGAKPDGKPGAKPGVKAGAKAEPPLTYWERKAKAEEAKQAKEAKRGGHRGKITDLGIGHADHSDQAEPARGSRSTGRAARETTRPKPRARRRPTRRRVLVRRWTALAVLLGVAGLVVALLVTPLLGVRGVTVTGANALSADAVRTAAAVPDGDPMLTLDTTGIAARVAALPRVATVDVTRQWPGTVRIAVTERTPVGVLTGPGGTHLVDATGYDFATVTAAPAGLPVIQLPAATPADPRTHAVVIVLAVLPPQLRGMVTSVSADTPGDVQLALSGGRSVRWGSADDSGRKVAVLAALLTRPGKLYDVSAPDLPTIS